MANTIGEKELKTKWPHESGLTAGTQKQAGRQSVLIPQGLHGVKDLTSKNDRVGL